MPSEPELQALVDKEAIRDVMGRYARAIDRRDTNLLRSCYHSDALLDFGASHPEKREDVDAHLESASAMSSWIDVSHHHIGNVFIELNGDTAIVESYVIDTLRRIDERNILAAGQSVIHTLFARYVDRFEKREGAWKIARRVVVQDLSESRIIVQPDYGFRPGSAGPDDVTYDPQLR